MPTVCCDFFVFIWSFLVNIGLGNGLMHDGTKPLPEPMLISGAMRFIRNSALLALCAGKSTVTGEFPAQRPVTRSFDVLFDLRLNNQLSKQSWGWWFEAPSCLFWRHCDDYSITATGNEHKCVLIHLARSNTHQRKHQSPVSLAFVRGIHRWPMDSPLGLLPDT